MNTRTPKFRGISSGLFNNMQTKLKGNVVEEKTQTKFQGWVAAR